MRKKIILSIVVSLVLSFPASGQKTESSAASSYEEILGKDKIELEDEFIYTIQEGIGLGYPFDFAGYEKAGGNFYLKKGNEYYTAQVRNDSYAEKKRGKLEPLWNVSYPKESIMTLFTTPAAATDFEIEILHHKYGFAEEKFTVNLADLLVSCMEAGCVPYVGIEECTKDSILVSIFLVNDESAYNHILKVGMDYHLLKSSAGCISADLYTYIPSHNISDLYAK